MGLPWCTWLIMCTCYMSGIYSYSIERIDDDNGKPVNYQIDFSSAETDKFFDDFEKNDNLIPNVRQVQSTKPPGTNGAQKQMFLLFVPNDNYTGGNNETTPLDSWSVVWYIASFGGLIVFFLIVSCSEWCCRRAIRNSQNCNRTAATASTANVPDTPPPSYDQFAPPSYESICLGRNERSGEKNEYDIYVVPVHTLGTLVESRRTEDAPPSYLSASGNFVPALTGLENSRVT